MIEVPGVGDPKADIFFVGEAPGKNEERERIPFVGSSGNLLRGVLSSLGFSPELAWIDNVCHFRPPGNKIEKFYENYTKRIPGELLVLGIKQLYETIAQVDPNVVVPLGNTSLWCLTGYEGISKYRGSILNISWDLHRTRIFDRYGLLNDDLLQAIHAITGKKVIPTFHPAYILRKYNDIPLFKTDIRRIIRDSKFPELNLPVRKLWVDPDEATLRTLWEQLRGADLLAYDIECIGHKLYCVGFSCDPSWALTLTVGDGFNDSVIRDLLESNIPKVAQNGLFDDSYLRMNWNCHVRNYNYDTMYAHHLAYSELPQGLDTLASIYTREPYWKDEGKDWDAKDAEDVQRFLEYNAKDTAATLEIWRKLASRELQDEHVGPMFEQIMKEVPVYVDMGINGVKIDLKEMERLREKYEADSLDLQDALDKAIINSLLKTLETVKDKKRYKLIYSFIQGMTKGLGTIEGGLNCNSSKQVGVFLYDILKLKEKKKKGKRTVEADALKELYGETGNPFLLTIVKIREKRKRISSYLNVKTNPEGHTWFSMKPTGTKTNRSSSGKTVTGYGLNIQTVPHELRSMYIAEPGYELAYIDYSQAEARVVAYKAGVSKMIACFEHPNPQKYTSSDVHSLTAHHTLGIPYDEMKEYPHRYLGKTQNHAFNYEMGPFKYAKRVNKDAEETGVRITNSQAKKMREAHFRLYPELEGVYWPFIREEIRSRRELVNPFGYKRRFFGRLDDDTFREAFSHYAQSTVACLLRRGMVAVYRGLVLPFRDNGYSSTRIIIEVHDALLVQYPIGSRDEFLSKAMKLMEIPFEVNGKEIVIPTDAAYGLNWGDYDEDNNPNGLKSYEPPC